MLGGIFYVIHQIIVKANLFFVSGAVNRLAGSTDLQTLGGLYRDKPLLAALFFVPAFSLAGFPPLSGFWAKLLLIQASVESDEFVLAGVALVVGLLTVFSMTKIWLNAFWKARPDEAGPPPAFPPRRRWLLLAPIATLATITLVIGLYARPLYPLAERPRHRADGPRDLRRSRARPGRCRGDRPRSRRQRGMRLFQINLLLAGGWCALFGTFDLGTFGVGLPPGVRGLEPVESHVRADRLLQEGPAGGPPGCRYFLYELTVSSFQVAWDALTPTHRSRPAIVAVPLDIEEPIQITVLANLISLTPGSLSLDVSPDGKTLYVHEMFADRSGRDAQADQDGLRAPGLGGHAVTELAGHSQIVTWAVSVTTVLTVLGLVFSFVRLIKGPSLPDRVVSVDLITVLAVAVAGLLAITHDEPDFLDIAVALALVAFLATVAFAWYAERTAQQLNRDGRAGERAEGPHGR